MHVCKERNAHPHACVYVRLVAYSRRTRGVLAAYSRSGSLSFSAPSELVERPAPLSTPLRRTFFIHRTRLCRCEMYIYESHSGLVAPLFLAFPTLGLPKPATKEGINIFADYFT
jgi:hypothetical protein